MDGFNENRFDIRVSIVAGLLGGASGCKKARDAGHEWSSFRSGHPDETTSLVGGRGGHPDHDHHHPWAKLAATGLVCHSGYNCLLHPGKIQRRLVFIYVFWLPIHHPRTPDIWGPLKPLLLKYWPSILLALIYTGTVVREARWHRWQFTDDSWQYLVFGLALLAALGFDQVSKFATNKIHSSKLALAAISLGSILLVAQFALLVYNPIAQLPPKEYQANTQRFIRYLSELPGNAWVFSHRFMTYQASKSTYFHVSTLSNIASSKLPPGTEVSQRQEYGMHVFRQALEGQYFQWIITDGYSDVRGP